jgi:hypothetical protein
MIAFHDLQQMVKMFGGDQAKGIDAFLAQNGGEGWKLPETLTLADYDLGDDARANTALPVASRLGPRFFDWQQEQNPDESWRETQLHARNILGKKSFDRLVKDFGTEKHSESPQQVEPPASALPVETNEQGKLF